MNPRAELKSLAGKVAIVTGAASGMGRATAELFAQSGAAVGVLDIDVERGKEVAEEIEAAGGRACFVAADVTSQQAVSDAVDQVTAQYGPLDCAVNNAATAPDSAALHEWDEELFRRVVEVDLVGVAVCLHVELKHLLDRQRTGSIVNIGSTRSHRASGAAPAYSAAKFGVIGLTEAAAQEYGSIGIRVNAVSPGVVETPMVQARRAASPETDEQYLGRVGGVMKRVGQPSEIARASLWLCSQESGYVTGHSLVVDGGYLIK